MKTGCHHNDQNTESAVANLIEYIMISGVTMGLLIVMLLLINTNIMEKPTNTIVYVSFTDIGNGISTRMVDVYAIAPVHGNITSSYDLPDDIVGQSYNVDIVGNSEGQTVAISRNSIISNVALAGVGASTHGQAGGSTTGSGVNMISYCSGGYDSNGNCLP